MTSPDTGSDTRQLLMRLICEEPGIHKSELARRADLSWSTVYYHLTKLERLNLIRTTRVAGVSYVSPTEASPADKPSEILMMPHARKLLRVLQRGGVFSPRNLQDLTELGEKTVRRTLNQMADEGLVRCDGAYHPRYWFAGSRSGPPMRPSAMGSIRQDPRPVSGR